MGEKDAYDTMTCLCSSLCSLLRQSGDGNIWFSKVITGRNQLSQKAHQHSCFPSTCPEASVSLGFWDTQVLELQAGQSCPATAPLVASSLQQPPDVENPGQGWCQSQHREEWHLQFTPL